MVVKKAVWPAPGNRGCSIGAFRRNPWFLRHRRRLRAWWWMKTANRWREPRCGFRWRRPRRGRNGDATEHTPWQGGARSLFRPDCGGRPFRIENFPANAQANLDVTKKGKALRGGGTELEEVFGNVLRYQPGKEEIRLVVEPSGAIVGNVIIRERQGVGWCEAAVATQDGGVWHGRTRPRRTCSGRCSRRVSLLGSPQARTK